MSINTQRKASDTQNFKVVTASSTTKFSVSKRENQREKSERREKMEIAAISARDLLLHQHEHQHQHQLHQSQSQKTEQANFRIRGGKKLLSLENYLDFLQSRDHQNLTVENMNEIISIHGFKKLKQRRSCVEEALGVIEPINPARSTLNDKISSQSLTLKEVIKDLGALNWQECSVTSIRSINSLNYAAPAPIPPKAPKAKKRSKLITALATPLGGSGSNGGGSGSGLSKSGPGSGSSSSLTPRAKRMSKSPMPLTTSLSPGDNGNGSGTGSSSVMVTEGLSGGGMPMAVSRKRSIKRIYLGEAPAVSQMKL